MTTETTTTNREATPFERALETIRSRHTAASMLRHSSTPLHGENTERISVTLDYGRSQAWYTVNYFTGEILSGPTWRDLYTGREIRTAA